MGWVHPLAGHLILKWYFVSFENQSPYCPVWLASNSWSLATSLLLPPRYLGRQAHTKTSSQLSLLIFGTVLFLGAGTLRQSWLSVHFLGS